MCLRMWCSCHGCSSDDGGDDIGWEYLKFILIVLWEEKNVMNKCVVDIYI